MVERESPLKTAPNPQSFYCSFLSKDIKRGVIFHTAALFGLPEDYQQASKSITRLGITQDNLK
jgi:hypothetical protein